MIQRGGGTGVFRKLSPTAFIVAFAVGLFVCYVTAPPPQVVVRHPSPYNAGRVMYTSQGGDCYTYEALKVPCPASGARSQPVEDFSLQPNHNP